MIPQVVNIPITKHKAVLFSANSRTPLTPKAIAFDNLLQQTGQNLGALVTAALCKENQLGKGGEATVYELPPPFDAFCLRRPNTVKEPYFAKNTDISYYEHALAGHPSFAPPFAVVDGRTGQDWLNVLPRVRGFLPAKAVGRFASPFVTHISASVRNSDKTHALLLAVEEAPARARRILRHVALPDSFWSQYDSPDKIKNALSRHRRFEKSAVILYRALAGFPQETYDDVANAIKFAKKREMVPDFMHSGNTFIVRRPNRERGFVFVDTCHRRNAHPDIPQGANMLGFMRSFLSYRRSYMKDLMLSIVSPEERRQVRAHFRDFSKKIRSARERIEEAAWVKKPLVTVLTPEEHHREVERKNAAKVYLKTCLRATARRRFWGKLTGKGWLWGRQ